MVILEKMKIFTRGCDKKDAHACVCASACMCARVCVRVFMYACIYACMHACMQVCMCVCVCVVFVVGGGGDGGRAYCVNGYFFCIYLDS